MANSWTYSSDYWLDSFYEPTYQVKVLDSLKVSSKLVLTKSPRKTNLMILSFVKRASSNRKTKIISTCIIGGWWKVKLFCWLKKLNIDISGSGLVIRVDVCHKGIPRAVDAFANHAPVLFLSFCMFVCDMSLQRCFRTEHFAAKLASEHLLGRYPCKSK